MNEIKFRLWDKVMRTMFYTGELANGDMIAIGIDGKLMLSDDATYEITDFELMQYTGLKDKNSREIYEGDILQSDIAGTKTNLKVCKGEYCNPINGYDALGWYVEHKNAYWRKDILYWVGGRASPETVIIGNKYQNPELLED